MNAAALYARARALLIAGSRQSRPAQEAYARSGAALLAMACEPEPWWDTCHADGCDVEVHRLDHDGAAYCSQACEDDAAQAWFEARQAVAS